MCYKYIGKGLTNIADLRKFNETFLFTMSANTWAVPCANCQAKRNSKHGKTGNFKVFKQSAPLSSSQFSWIRLNWIDFLTSLQLKYGPSCATSICPRTLLKCKLGVDQWKRPCGPFTCIVILCGFPSHSYIIFASLFYESSPTHHCFSLVHQYVPQGQFVWAIPSVEMFVYELSILHLLSQ